MTLDLSTAIEQSARMLEAYNDGLMARELREAYEADLRSHEPPRNSGEGTAVNGPMPLAGGDDAHEPT